MVQGYLEADIRKLGPGRWEVRGYGACTTVRFEDPTPGVDLERSENVLGWVREPQGLFVSLAPDRDRAVVQLTEEPPSLPYLRKAAGRVDAVERGPGRFSLRYRGFGEGSLEIGGLEPNRPCVLSGTSLSDAELEVVSDAEGVLTVPSVGTGTLSVTW
jgi:hypothetical protein